jgi:polyhydroxyalkanoate synthesis repressor PhaR
VAFKYVKASPVDSGFQFVVSSLLSVGRSGFAALQQFYCCAGSHACQGQNFVMPAKRVIVKKYENRRLYDTTNSRYVNLDEVAQMLRKGADVQAVDATTGEDITRLVLTQIIVEGAKDNDSCLPLDLLRQMVIATGKVSQETFLNYMRAMFEMYQNTYRGFAHVMPQFDLLQRMLPPAAGQADVAPVQRDATGVSELRRRIDELEKHLAAPVAKKRKRRSGTARRR